MKNVILIVNPVSGKLKGKAALFGVIEALSANDIVPTVLLTKGRGDAIRLARDAAGLNAEGRCDAVLCCGGDGTLNEVLTGLREAHSKMPVGYIPAGTTNDFANGLTFNSMYTVAGFEPDNYDSDLKARKSYFFFDIKQKYNKA